MPLVRAPFRKKAPLISPVQKTDLKKPIEDFYNLNQIIGQFKKIHQDFLDNEVGRDETFDSKVQEVNSLIEKMQSEIERIQYIKQGAKGEPGEDGETPNIVAIAATVLQKIRQPEDGKPGKDANEEGIMVSVLKKIPTLIAGSESILKKIASYVDKPEDGKPGKDVSPDMAVQMFLEYLKEHPLEVSNIKGLENIHRSMFNQIGMSKGTQESQSGTKWKMRGGGDTLANGMGTIVVRNPDGTISIDVTSSGNTVYGEVPSGSGVHFTLAHSPTGNTLRLYRGGARQQAGVDFTISGNAITLMQTLDPREILLADYSY